MRVEGGVVVAREGDARAADARAEGGDLVGRVLEEELVERAERGDVRARRRGVEQRHELRDRVGRDLRLALADGGELGEERRGGRLDGHILQVEQRDEGGEGAPREEGGDALGDLGEAAQQVERLEGRAQRHRPLAAAAAAARRARVPRPPPPPTAADPPAAAGAPPSSEAGVSIR